MNWIMSLYNSLPDEKLGEFLQALLRELRERGYEYITIKDGLVYIR